MATAAATAGTVSGGGASELLARLGLEPARVDPSIYQQLAGIIRVVVQGMLGVLQARAEVKNNFRMSMTSIRPVENNPLKFSLNADDALHNLFVKRNPGYLGPAEAFYEGFQDIAFPASARPTTRCSGSFIPGTWKSSIRASCGARRCSTSATG
jgi:type VI secretion system FHA domain protein